MTTHHAVCHSCASDPDADGHEVVTADPRFAAWFGSVHEARGHRVSVAEVGGRE